MEAVYTGDKAEVEGSETDKSAQAEQEFQKKAYSKLRNALKKKENARLSGEGYNEALEEAQRELEERKNDINTNKTYRHIYIQNILKKQL